MPETFQQLVSRMNASAFFPRDLSTPSATTKKADELAKVLRTVQTMTAEQAEVFLDLLEGHRVLIQARFACKRSPIGWSVYSVESDTGHTINVDLSACSCADSRLRGKECKHIKALKEYTSATS